MSIKFFYSMYVTEHGPQIALEEFERITTVDWSTGHGPVHDAMYEMYTKGLGGKLDRKDYDLARDKFEEITGPAFCGGEGSRKGAANRYTRWLRQRFPGETFNRVFSSVDLIAAWT